MKSILFFLLVFPIISIAQNRQYVVFKGKVNSDKLQTLRVYEFGINNKLENTKLDTIFQITPFEPFTFSLSLDHKGMYGLQDGMWSMFTHDIFLRPGDTITLFFNPRPNYKNQMDGLHPVFTAHIMSALGKYPGNLIYFDSIEHLRPLRYGHINGESLTEYKIRCDSFYHIWLDVLDKFRQRNKVSSDFIAYTKVELYCRYISWLIDPVGMLPGDDFPKDYFNIANIPDFNNNKYMEALKSYGKAALAVNSHIRNSRNIDNGYDSFRNGFNAILKENTGPVRDKMMAIKIISYLGKRNTYFDTAYTLFLKNCQTTAIRRLVKNKITENHSIDKAYLKSLKWIEVLTKTKVYSSLGKLVSLKKIISEKKMCIIDCWATWCIPCRTQMPYLKKIEEKFKDSVQFISISFDKRKESWKRFIKSNKKQLTGSQYRLYNGPNSQFTRYFKIEAIPRYILLSKGGKQVLITNMPMPNLENRFEDQIKKYLSK